MRAGSQILSVLLKECQLVRRTEDQHPSEHTGDSRNLVCRLKLACRTAKVKVRRELSLTIVGYVSGTQLSVSLADLGCECKQFIYFPVEKMKPTPETGRHDVEA